jgi:ketosteroid isomerase-like protein
MSAAAHIETIRGVYEAFGRGDIGAILDAVTDDVDWASEAALPGAPWWGPRHGKDDVAAFFAAFGTTMEVLQFDPISIVGNDTEVHSVVAFKVRHRVTGKEGASNLHHWFQFRGELVSFYRGSEDTFQTESLLRA